MLGCPFSYCRKMTLIVELVPSDRSSVRLWRFGRHQTLFLEPQFVWFVYPSPSTRHRMHPYPTFAGFRIFGGCGARVLRP